MDLAPGRTRVHGRAGAAVGDLRVSYPAAGRQVLTELLAVHGLATGPAAARRCAELVEQVALPAEALDRPPVSFSGGQRPHSPLARQRLGHKGPSVWLCEILQFLLCICGPRC